MGGIGKNTVENNVYGVIDKNGKLVAGANNKTKQKLDACANNTCVKNVLMENAQDAMKGAPQVVTLNNTPYKEGDVISGIHSGSGLRYLVVNENGVFKAKLLPVEYQTIYSISQLENSRKIVGGGALGAPLANIVVGLHDAGKGTSLFTNEELSKIDRAFAAMDAAGSLGMVTGAFLPKGTKATSTTSNSKVKVENNIHRDDDLWSNKSSGKQEYNSNFQQNISKKDIEYLKNNNIKFSEKDIISTVRAPDGKVVFLENGTEKAGFVHVVKEHQKDFEKIGVKVDDIPKVLMDAVKKGNIVGYQGKGTGRPIYETVINGEKKGIAITIGNNGFIVGANPTRLIK